MKTELENANFNRVSLLPLTLSNSQQIPLSKLLVSLTACGALQSIFHVAGFVFV
jgi:hypothetical protein